MKNSINMVARFIYWMSKQRLMSHSTNIRLHFTINNTGNTNQTHTTNRNTIKQVNWTQYTINNNIKRILKYNIRMAELREGEKICLTVSIWYTNNDTWMHRLFCIYTVVQKNAPTSADYNYNPVQSILIIFSKLFVNDHKSCLVV